MSVVDTNLLIHATSPASVENARAQAALIRLTISEPVAIPRQVMREYLSVTTGRGFGGVPISMSLAMAAIGSFCRMFEILEDGPRVWAEFEKLVARHSFAGKQVHDANIVATMLAHGQTRLLTYNLKDFRRFQPLIEIIEP